MNAWKTFVISGLFWLAGGELANGQFSKELQSSMNQYKEKHPELSMQAFQNDSKTLQSIQPQLKSSFKGFNASDVNENLISTWTRVRSQLNPTQPVTGPKVLAEALTQGQLIVDSDPDGASVTINQQSNSRTKLTTWLPAGTYHIALTKVGYKSVEGDQVVSSGTSVTFKRTLRK